MLEPANGLKTISSSAQSPQSSIRHVAIPLDTQRLLSILKVMMTKLEDIEKRLETLSEELDPTWTVELESSSEEESEESESESQESDDSAQSAPF